MYVQGVSTRDVAAVMDELGLEKITSTQVSRAAAELDDDLEKWRSRSLSEVHQLILDARYEKVRHDGVVIDVAVLSAVGILPEGLTVLKLPKSQRRRLRTSNGIERPIQQELKRRTVKIRVFPNVESLLRLVSAILVEIDDEWTSSTKRYLPEAEVDVDR